MRNLIFGLAGLLSATAYATTPQDLINTYAAQAKQDNLGFKEFSTSRSEQFYRNRLASTPSLLSGVGYYSKNLP